MRISMVLTVLSIVVSSCTKDSDNFETSQGKVSLVGREGKAVPLDGIEVFIRTGQCQGDNWFSPGTCEFVEDLKERAFTDDQGNYSIRFMVQTGRTFEPKIVLSENYRLVRSGGRNPQTPGETFYYDFLLEKVD